MIKKVKDSIIYKFTVKHILIEKILFNFKSCQNAYFIDNIINYHLSISHFDYQTIGVHILLFLVC